MVAKGSGGSRVSLFGDVLSWRSSGSRATEERPTNRHDSAPCATDASGYKPDEIRRSLVWITAAWLPGSAFFAITTGVALTSFLKQALKVGDLGYGLIMAAGPAAVVFLVLGSLSVERSGRSKRRFLVYVTIHRLLWLAVAAIPLLFPDLPNRWATGTMGIVAFLAAAVANYGNSGWSVWVSDIVPKSIAGRFFGVRSSLGLISMCLSSWLVARLIQGDPTDARLYAWVFAAAAILGALDVSCFTFVPERPRPVPEVKPGLWSILSVPWRNSPFRRFAAYSFTAWFAYNMMGPFVWPFCFDSAQNNGLGLGTEATNWYLSVFPLLAMALMSPFWGSAIDRFGPKPVLGVGSMMAVVMPTFWLFVHRGVSTTLQIGPVTLRPDLIWLVPVVQFVGGLTWAAIEQTIFYVQIKGFPEERRSAYIASYQLVLLAGAMSGVAFAGVCATFWQAHLREVGVFPSWYSHYQPVFLTSILIRLAAFVFLFPRLRLEGTAQFRVVARSVASEARNVVRRRLRRRS